MAWTKRTGAVIGAGTLVALSGSAGIAAGQESPGGDGGCPVVAVAQGVQLTVSKSDDLALRAPTGLSVPSAQACLNYALSKSSAFAGNPYPGETVLTAPGLVRGLTSTPVPDYPWYVNSEYPSSKRAGYREATISLRASSTETSSDADARSRQSSDAGEGGSTIATAEAEIDPASGGSAATAASDTSPLVINDVLQLGRVRSTAAARLSRDGKIQRNSRLEIGRTMVAGQEVKITPDGLHAGGQTAGLPDEEPADLLEQAGVTVRYLAAERTANGVLSAGLDVRARNEDPQTGAVTTVHYVLGRTFAAVAPLERAAPSPQVPGAPPSPASGSSGSTGVSGSAPQAAEAPEAPADAGQVPEAAPAPEPAVAAPVMRTGMPLDIGLSGAYLVIVLGALVMFASGTLLRMLGVKTRWTS